MDARLVQVVSGEAVTLDLLLMPAGDLDTTQELATAVTVALGTDRLALPDDVLPGLDDDDRRGWWGDRDAEVIWDGWPIGTRLWLLDRDKITGSGSRDGATLARAETYVREALRPFVERRIATHVDVVASRSGIGQIDVVATMYRGPLPAIQLSFAELWSGIEA